MEKKIYDELKEQINMVELAAMHGYQVNQRKSTKTAGKISIFMERGDDKIIVYPNQGKNEDYHFSTCNNHNDSGSIFDFLINKGFVRDFRQAIPYLKNLDPGSLVLTSPKVTPKKEVTPFKPYAVFPIDNENYLIRERYLTLQVLRSPLFSGTVFSGNTLHGTQKVKATIFPLFIGNKVVGQNIRNIDNFKHLVENSDKSNGFWRSNALEAKSPIAVFENPIDAISHHILHGKNYHYHGTIGSPSRHVQETIVNNSLTKNIPLVLCGDHDKAGQHLNLSFLSRYISISHQIDLITTFNSTTNVYSLILNGTNTDQQRQAFDSIAKKVGADTGKLSFSVDKIQLQTAYQVTALKKITTALLDVFALKDVSVERSLGKDFNEDLKMKMQQPEQKKKVMLGLSL